MIQQLQLYLHLYLHLLGHGLNPVLARLPGIVLPMNVEDSGAWVE